jgi:hypothetical protein
VEERVHLPGALRGREELIAEAQQPARRDEIREIHRAVAALEHVRHLPASSTEHLDDGAHVSLGDLDVDFFDGFEQFTGLALPVDDLRLGHLKLVSLAAHGLDEDGEVQLAAPGDEERVGGLGILHAQRDVVFELSVQPLADLAGGAPRPLAARERRGVHPERHPHRRRFHVDAGESDRVLRVRERLADQDLVQPGHASDLAGLHLFDLDALQALEDVQVCNLARVHVSVVLEARDRLALAQDAVEDAPHGHAPLVIVIGQIGDEHLQGRVRVHFGRRDMLKDRVEQRLVIGRQVGRESGLLGERVRIQDGELGLAVARAQFDEQVKRSVDRVRRSAFLRSTLLMTTMALCPISSALRRTKRVCGIGPSAASTSRSTPSTIFITRSTSPPKSAWPGVSTMLILTSW